MDCDKNIIMLTNDISKKFHNVMRKRSNEDSKMITYRPILHMLLHHDGCNQLDIVKFTNLKAPTISITLRNMELDGLIERKIDNRDKRNAIITLTNKGKEQNEKIHNICEGMTEEVLNEISLEKQNVVKDILLEIIMKLEELQ